MDEQLRIILIIIVSVSIFGLFVFVFVKNYIRNKIDRLLKDENNAIRISPTILYAVSSRSGNMDTIDNLRETSIDYYSSLKSIYYQNRYASPGNSSDNLIIDDFFETLDEENKNE